MKFNGITEIHDEMHQSLDDVIVANFYNWLAVARPIIEIKGMNIFGAEKYFRCHN